MEIPELKNAGTLVAVMSPGSVLMEARGTEPEPEQRGPLLLLANRWS